MAKNLIINRIYAFIQQSLKWAVNKSSETMKISTKSMYWMLVWEICPANNTTRCSGCHGFDRGGGGGGRGPSILHAKYEHWLEYCPNISDSYEIFQNFLFTLQFYCFTTLLRGASIEERMKRKEIFISPLFEKSQKPLRRRILLHIFTSVGYYIPENIHTHQWTTLEILQEMLNEHDWKSINSLKFCNF